MKANGARLRDDELECCGRHDCGNCKGTGTMRCGFEECNDEAEIALVDVRDQDGGVVHAAVCADCLRTLLKLNCGEHPAFKEVA